MRFTIKLAVFSRRKITVIGTVLSWSLLVAGCAQTRVGTPVQNRNHIESVAFTTGADRIEIIDQATSTLISSNFSITLANDRIGLVQSDFVSVATIQRALADTLSPNPDLENLLMKVSVNADSGNETALVQVKGTFQRITGTYRSSDNLIGLYWLEQLADLMAVDLDAQFVHQLTDSTYAQLVAESQNEAVEKESPGLSGALKAGGIVLAVLFAVTLAAGAFGPAANRPDQTPSFSR